MISPPAAGPIEKPKFIAKRMSVTERVLFSGLLYALMATNAAGRKVSATIISTNTPMHNVQNVSKYCSPTNKNPDNVKLQNITG